MQHLPLSELKDRLASKVDLIDLLELLNITAPRLLDAFEDEVVEREQQIMSLLEEDNEFSPEEYYDDNSR